MGSWHIIAEVSSMLSTSSSCFCHPYGRGGIVRGSSFWNKSWPVNPYLGYLAAFHAAFFLFVLQLSFQVFRLLSSADVASSCALLHLQ